MRPSDLVAACSVLLWAPALLDAQLVRFSADLGGHRSLYTGLASDTYLARSDGAQVRPVAGPMLGVHLGLRLSERRAEQQAQAHWLQLDFTAAYSPELVAVRQTPAEVPAGQPVITDYTGQAVLLSSQLQLVLPRSRNAAIYLGVGPGRLIRSGPEFQGTEGASRNGLMLSIGVVPYVLKGFDQRAGVSILTDGSHHDLQLSFGITVAWPGRGKGTRTPAPRS